MDREDAEVKVGVPGTPAAAALTGTAAFTRAAALTGTAAFTRAVGLTGTAADTGAAALTGTATAADVHMAQVILSRTPGAKGATADCSLRGSLR